MNNVEMIQDLNRLIQSINAQQELIALHCCKNINLDDPWQTKQGVFFAIASFLDGLKINLDGLKEEIAENIRNCPITEDDAQG